MQRNYKHGDGHPELNRRRCLSATATATASGALTASARDSRADESPDVALPVGNLHLGTFRFDVTPPSGHSLCGGWIKPVIGVDDPLEAIGYVLLWAGKPIDVCVVDWTGILNSAHLQWRKTLADAACTTIDRVTVHCVHQDYASFECLDAEQIVLSQGDLPHIVDRDFFRLCLDAG